MTKPNKQKKYVFNGTEVQLTGRIAEKELRRGVDTLYEIKPFDVEQGSWRKWVRLNDLYEIKIFFDQIKISETTSDGDENE